MDIQRSRRAIRLGALATAAIGLAKAGLVAYAMSGKSGTALQYWSDPLELTDTAILLVFALAVLRHSRLAAIGLVIYVIAIKIVISLMNANYVETGLGVALLPFAVQAVRGTFAYHPNRKNEDPTYRATRLWHYILGVPATAVFAALIALAMGFEFGFIPVAGLIKGEELPARVHNTLIKKGIVRPEENIILYYSTGLFSYEEDGNVLTDQRLVYYFEDADGDLIVDWTYTRDIEDVDIIEETTPEGQGILQVTTDYGDRFVLYLPADEKAQMEFLMQIGLEMAKHQTDNSQPHDSEVGMPSEELQSSDEEIPVTD